jgi:hypothetical protein
MIPRPAPLHLRHFTKNDEEPAKITQSSPPLEDILKKLEDMLSQQERQD